MRPLWRKAILLAALFVAAPAAAQNQQQPDRGDPAIIERELEPRELPSPPRPRLEVDAPNQGSAAQQSTGLAIGAIHVRGASRIPAQAFAPAIEPFLGSALSQADLTRLATAVATVARRAGYGLATAWVPAQDVSGGVLTVQVDEGRIDGVRASGPAAALVEQRLRSIVGGEPVRTDELERQLLLAGDMAGLWVGQARLVREGGRNILRITTRHQRVQGRVSLDNWGNDTVGPVRAWAEVDVNGVIRRGDGLALGIATTPLEPDTFQLVEGRYRLPLGGRGTTFVVGGYYGRTDVEPDQNTIGFRGDSWEVEAELVHPLERSRSRSLWLTGRFEVRDSELERRNGVLVRDDRTTSATASLYGYDRFAGGRLRIRASVVQGLDLFGATRPGDPLASRDDAGGVFTKLETWAEYWRPLGGGFSAELAVRAQLSDAPLLSSEEMGLGGPQFLRAFDYRELSGDEGVAASAELRFDLRDISRTIGNVQFYAYGDAGRVSNHVGRGGSLASAGGGVRVRFAKDWDAGVELGVPLTDGAIDNNPEPRFSFTVRTRF